MAFFNDAKMHHRSVCLQCLWVIINNCGKFKVSRISGSWVSRNPVYEQILLRYYMVTATTMSRLQA